MWELWAFLFIFFFFHWETKQSCTVSVCQMPDPQQGLGSEAQVHLGGHWEQSQDEHRRRGQNLQYKVKPRQKGKEGPLGCWVCCNPRQFFGCLNPKTTTLMFLSGKTLTFSPKEKTGECKAEALNLWFQWRGKRNFSKPVPQDAQGKHKEWPQLMRLGKGTLRENSAWECPKATGPLQSQSWEPCVLPLHSQKTLNKKTCV